MLNLKIGVAFMGLSAFAADLAAAAPGPAGAAAAAPQEIRVSGSAFGGVVEKWQHAFREADPAASFSNRLQTSDLAFPTLISGAADLATTGAEPGLTETLGFYETRQYHPEFIVVGTGSFDQRARSNGPVIVVSERNPIESLSIDQLDGIFGAERNGGMRGFEWTATKARDASLNIRRWDQLGLSGQWQGKAIQTYGMAPSGTSRFFQLKVLGSSEKWNENYRAYVETDSKMIPADERGQQLLGFKHMLKELADDPHGIAWTIGSQLKGAVGLKTVAIAPRGGGTAVAPSDDSFRDRSYPLVRNLYIYFDRAPGAPVRPELKRFLRYVLSEDAQRMIASGGYYPLAEDARQEQVKKLEQM